MSSYNSDHCLKSITESLGYLPAIAASLASLAAYVEELRVERSGEETFEVGSWVLSSTRAGDPCVFLYSTHPKRDYRETTVYVERFGELPFDPLNTQVSLYTGEQAPSRTYAAQKGFLVPCAPFTIAKLPTGGTTEAGHPVYRFSRVVEAPATSAPRQGAPMEPSPAPASRLPDPVPAPEPPASDPLRQLPIMKRLADLEEHYLIDRGLTGPAGDETWQIWEGLTYDLFGLEAAQTITAALLGETVQALARSGYLPRRSRLAAIMGALLATNERGQPVRPARLRDGAEGELREVLAAVTTGGAR